MAPVFPSLHVLRVCLVLCVDDSRSDLSRVLWVACAVCLHEPAGRARNRRRCWSGDWSSRSAAGVSSARSWPSRFGAATYGSLVHCDAADDQRDRLVTAGPPRHNDDATVARRPPWIRSRTVRDVAVRKIRARYLSDGRVAEVFVRDVPMSAAV